MRLIRGLALILLASGLAACGNEPSPGGSSAELTSRAIAAVMLDHLSSDTARREASYEDETTPKSFVGADFWYGDEGENSDLVRVTVQRAPMPPCREVVECAELDGSTRLSWQEEEPEEDPGVVAVQHTRGDELVTVYISGPLIKGDPRDIELSPSVETMADLARDDRLRLQASAAVLAAGDDVTGWKGGEPDEAALAEVPNNDRTIVTGWIWSYGDTFRYLGPSPLKKRLGPDAVAGRVRLGDGFELFSGRTLDAFATSSAPAWVTAPCDLMATSGMAGYRCAEVNGLNPADDADYQDLRLIWRAESGDAFLVSPKGEGAVGFHINVGKLSTRPFDAAQYAGAYMYGTDLIKEPDGGPILALTTTQEKFDAAMKRG